MLESFEEVFPQDEAPYSPSTLKYLEDWLELFSIVRKGHQIHQEILQEDNLNRTVEILRRILASFIDPWNLYPLDETKASCVHRCAEMILDFRWKGFLRADSTVDIDATILKIIVSINTGELYRYIRMTFCTIDIYRYTMVIFCSNERRRRRFQRNNGRITKISCRILDRSVKNLFCR